MCRQTLVNMHARMCTIELAHVLFGPLLPSLASSSLLLLPPSPSPPPLSQSTVSADNLVQASVKPLSVKPGGLVTITVKFIVDDFTPNRRLTTSKPMLAGVCWKKWAYQAGWGGGTAAATLLCWHSFILSPCPQLLTLYYFPPFPPPPLPPHSARLPRMPTFCLTITPA